MLPDNPRNKDKMKKHAHKFQWFSAGIFLLFFLSLENIAAGTQGYGGRITGQIVDTETGEFLLGATIQLEDTNIGTFCDLDGTYTFSRVPAGTYDMAVYLMGYSKTIIQSVNVRDGDVTKLDVGLKPEPIMGREVVVKARAIENNEAALLKKRQRSNSVSDAISAEGLSRSGSGDAADAVSKVTGVSVVGGQYVYIRGLGERYSSAHLNGTELPSADPDKKAFQMDILPSNLLENITVIKSFTPDQPGSFSGGIIDVGTKSYPENLTVKFSTSASYNNQANLNGDYLTYQGSDWDWLGFDDGLRDIPDNLKNADIPDISTAFGDPDNAYRLDALSESFNSVMSPIRKSPPLNQSYSLAVGNMVDFEENRQLGYLVSFNYNRKHSFYDEGEVGRWRLAGNIEEAQLLGKDFYLSDIKGTDEVLWGGLFTGSYKPNLNHEFGINYIHTQSGESMARYLTGKFYDGNLPEDAVYETRVLKYTERTLNSIQLNGDHQLNSIFGMRAEWKAAYTANTQDEPDLRFFSNHYTVTEDDTFFTIRPSHYTVPQRYFRNLKEDNLGFDLKLALPFDQWSGLSSKFSFGSYFSAKNRTFRERVFEYQNQNANAYDGDPDDFFSDENCGIIDSSSGYYEFGNYVVDASELRANYNGEEQITAVFGMVELPLNKKLKFVGGIRFETTQIDVVTQDVNYEKGELDDSDLLPSVSLIYRLTDNMNLRTAYGKTLARPTFRELAPFPSWDFANGFFFIGNTNLKRALIDNYDIRWEWFSNPGEILAASVFYKNFENPIERAIKNDNGEIQYQNVDEAVVYGAEFEIRKKLDMFHSSLSNFGWGLNLSLIHSQVDVPEDELIIIRAYDPDASDTRPLQGQSAYILNIDITYNNTESKTLASLTYNVFGERLSEVSLGGTPDIYEQPRPILNFIFHQNIMGNISLKASVKNILDSPVKKIHEFKGGEYIYQKYQTGRSLTLGLSYELQ